MLSPTLTMLGAKGQEKTSRKMEERSAQEYDVLPPQIVAMQRERRNVNKGSERWLCFGGATGATTPRHMCW